MKGHRCVTPSKHSYFLHDPLAFVPNRLATLVTFHQWFNLEFLGLKEEIKPMKLELRFEIGQNELITDPFQPKDHASPKKASYCNIENLKYRQHSLAI